jgi:hypothetical protein
MRAWSGFLFLKAKSNYHRLEIVVVAVVLSTKETVPRERGTSENLRWWRRLLGSRIRGWGCRAVGTRDDQRRRSHTLFFLPQQEECSLLIIFNKNREVKAKKGGNNTKQNTSIEANV